MPVGYSSNLDQVKQNLTDLMRVQSGTDSSVNNASSIAFLFEYQDIKGAFLGDSKPSVCMEGLKKFDIKGVSESLLDATLDMDSTAVAAQIEKIHNEYVSVIQYHNENSLSSVLAIAYLSAMQYYFKPIRELPTGRGFADFVFVPKPEYKNDYPALIVELKWNKNARTAMRQIKDRKYPTSILNYTGEILLVGINYDKNSKEHQCLIEKYEKD